MDSFINILGYIAGLLTTIAFLPQVIKTWESKSAADLSLGMFAIFCCGVLLWLLYGLLLGKFPIILANAATLILASTLLYFKLKYK
jgi:MtN3 and saliva related transmembrane protein